MLAKINQCAKQKHLSKCKTICLNWFHPRAETIHGKVKESYYSTAKTILK